MVDRATAAFDEIIAAERAAGGGHNDHFAKAGANDRIWNALEKLAGPRPGTFVDYYGNDILALISTAWLGPGYQMTSQVNVVRPGGQAQDPHRDYHLGFLSNETAARYPAHVHLLSPVLTLQGAVAHSDMPIESGPTMYLPYSHAYEPGYLAWRLPEFREFFADRYVQLPLAKGDAVFFNPALFHGAGTNVSADVQRMANLLQVSSAFGRAMETVDRAKVSRAIYPVLKARRAAGVDRSELANALACAAEGYPFPSNLDLTRTSTGSRRCRRPRSSSRALDEGWSDERLDRELTAYDVGTARMRSDGPARATRSSWSAAAPRASVRASPGPPSARGRAWWSAAGVLTSARLRRRADGGGRRGVLRPGRRGRHRCRTSERGRGRSSATAGSTAWSTPPV